MMILEGKGFMSLVSTFRVQNQPFLSDRVQQGRGSGKVIKGEFVLKDHQGRFASASGSELMFVWRSDLKPGPLDLSAHSMPSSSHLEATVVWTPGSARL